MLQRSLKSKYLILPKCIFFNNFSSNHYKEIILSATQHRGQLDTIVKYSREIRSEMQSRRLLFDELTIYLFIYLFVSLFSICVDHSSYRYRCHGVSSFTRSIKMDQQLAAAAPVVS